MKPRPRSFLVVGIALLSGVPCLRAGTHVLPVDDIRRGQQGTARTVFEGTEAEPFQVEVLGVARNGLGPGRDLVIVRLMGERVEHTGVVAGMSGSPVTIGGQLVGALAYRLGAFAKEPIAGVTPFAYMEDIPAGGREMGATAPFPGAEGPLPPLRGREGAEGLLVPPSWGAGPAMGVVPIATPLLAAGAAPRLLELLEPSLAGSGWMLLSGGAGSPGPASPGGRAGLVAGDAVGAQLMRGDMNLTLTGTVTAVQGDRVWAFGHPLLRAGPTRLPMTQIQVIATIPSQFNSYKLGNAGETVGTFDQDRVSGVAGRLGPGPELVPLRVSLEAEGFGSRSFRYEIVDHPAWTPFLVQSAVLNSLQLDISKGEEATLTVATTVRAADLPEARFRERYTRLTGGAPEPAVAASADVGRLVASLTRNRFRRPRLESMDVEMHLIGRRRYAVLEEVIPSRYRVRPGEEVTLRLILSPYRRERAVEEVSFRVPEDLAPGDLELLVASAAALEQFEAPVMQARLRQTRGLEDLVRWINDLRSSDRVYLRAFRREPGAVMGGRFLPALPGSVLSVLEDGEAEDFTPLATSTVSEESYALEEILVGGRTVTLQVIPGGVRGGDVPGDPIRPGGGKP